MWIHASQVNLSENELCGLDYRGRGTYTIEGISALANALSVNTSVTQVSQIRKMSQSWHELSYCTCIWQLDLSYNCLGGYYDDDDNFVSDPSGVKELAGALAVNASITQVMPN